MTYYMLKCQTCKIAFRPLLASSPDELLFPDYDEVRDTCGNMNADNLERFHDEHEGHRLKAVIDSTVDPPSLPAHPQADASTPARPIKKESTS
jgi:hypothetical protein